ncbi:MAG: sugar ABC transporter ATP-binding protein [Beutenbergiaceae bacterium]
MSSESDVVLRMSGIAKSFSGTAALVSGDLSIRAGEVHALMGQNGAGKSTLIKVLTGVYHADAGTMEYLGRPAQFKSPHDAQDHGISPIYQEINLVGQRTVAENIYLAREPRRWGLVDRATMVDGARSLLARVGVDVDPTAVLETLSTATQQMVAIARALSFDAKLIIMDEPTSSLHDREVETLFEVIRQLKSNGMAVIFVSHKLDELYRICDRITILRDGATVLESRLQDLSRLDLVATMLGREPEAIAEGGQTAFTRSKRRAGGEPVLTADGLAVAPNLREASLKVRSGEILGVAGLLGAGRSELAAGIYGASPLRAGRVTLGGQPYTPRGPRSGIAAGIAMTPEDRKSEGLVEIMTIAENITLSLLPRISRFGVINFRAGDRLTDRFMQTLGIKARDRSQLVGELSGGNQQKVLLARALVLEPQLLILDEPTRGVDVGAKREIQRLISEVAIDDRGVMLISSEMEEIAEGSDRIQVLRDGLTVASLDARTVTNAQIMIYMASGDVVESEASR